jgi:hypothetical protein
MRRAVIAAAALVLAVLASLHPAVAAGAGNDGGDASRVMWSGGMGLSYPLLVSVSAGAIVPLARRKENSPYGFPGVPALHANVDIGLGGGMASGGLAFPLKVAYGSSAISIKGAALRTWLADVGPDRNRTYLGGVTEILVESHPSGKIGLGYFRDRDSSRPTRDHFVFIYVGIGL